MAALRASAVVLAVLLAGCGVDGLAFREDERLTIVRPDDHDSVPLPVTLRWEVDDGVLADGSYTYGVVIDRSPPPPGKSLDWLFRNDDLCGEDGCRDLAYRSQRGVFETEATSLDVAEMPTNVDRRDEADHEATVFLLDGSGHRVGESAWTVEFSIAGVDG
jgi:hypothetical protein